jgi:hypothetical protein
LNYFAPEDQDEKKQYFKNLKDQNMTTRQRLESLLNELPSSSYQGGLAKNSTLKWHRKLWWQGEHHYNVWAIWTGGLEPEIAGDAQEIEQTLLEEIENNKLFG